MKRHLILILPCLLALAASGCARFSTTQNDYHYNTDGTVAAKISTKAASYTLFSSKSDLTSFKAKQTEATQAAEVGSLVQQGDTNLVNYIDAAGRLAAVIVAEMAKMAKPVP